MHYHVPSVTIDRVPDPLPDQLTVLDVRELVEWQHGHIGGAIHIPLQELPERHGELPVGEIMIVCTMGGRSAKAVAYLSQLGVTAVNLEGGLLDWAQADRPMVSETAQDPLVV